MNFLNEVMRRHPKAISFAPGAPHPDLIGEVDVVHCLNTYIRHQAQVHAPDERKHLLEHLEYGPAQGIINELLAEAFRNDGMAQAEGRNITVTNGAQEALFLTLRAIFTSPNQVLAVTNPGYAGILGAARMLDIRTTPVADTENGPSLDDLGALIGQARSQNRSIRALYVAPDFANPSGNFMDLASRKSLCRLAQDEGVILLEDTAYGFSSPASTRPPTLKQIAPASTILIGTFSKVGFPGARVGFVLAEQRVQSVAGEFLPLASQLATLKSMISINTSPLGQAVIGGLLLEHGLSISALGERHRVLYQSNLKCLLLALDEQFGSSRKFAGMLEWNRPEGGFFVRIRTPMAVDHSLLARSADEFGVLWTPMRFFSLDQSCDNELRLSCSYLDHAQIEEGASRLRDFFEATL